MGGPGVLPPCMCFHACWYLTHDIVTVCFLSCLSRGTVKHLGGREFGLLMFQKTKSKFGGHLQPLLPRLPWVAGPQCFLSHSQFLNTEADSIDSGSPLSELLLLLPPHYSGATVLNAQAPPHQLYYVHKLRGASNRGDAK